MMADEKQITGSELAHEKGFSMVMTMNSSICHGCVQCWVAKQPNITPMCSSSKTAGKKEQGEINWIWPGGQMEPTVHWMLERNLMDGGVSFPRTGETYPTWTSASCAASWSSRNPRNCEAPRLRRNRSTLFTQRG
jgi:hypothetical protein